MRRLVAALLLLFVGFQLSAIPAVATEATDEASRLKQRSERWVPAGSIFTMGMPDKRVAQASSDTMPDQEGDSTGFPWSLGLSGEIATPVIADLPGRPRLYAHGDVSWAFDTEEPVVSSGDPGAPPFSPSSANPVVETIENVGSAVRIEAKPLVLSGGVGAVFSFEAFERDFRLRPSIEWIYRRDTINTVLGSGENEVAGNLCGPCRTLFIQAQTEKGFHSLGPGIELEVDAARTGDFLIGFFGAFRAYRVLGDRKADLVSTGAWERTDGQPTARADTVFRTRYEREPWSYRFGLGIRFLWSPE